MATMTYHAQIEREARLDYIIDCFGDFGTPIAQIVDTYHGHKEEVIMILTNLGVVIIKAVETNRVVTAYIANVKQTANIYCNCYHCSRCPDNVIKRARYNAKFLAKQP